MTTKRAPARYYVYRYPGEGGNPGVWQVFDRANDDEVVLLDPAMEQYASFGTRREAREWAERLNAHT